MRSFARSLPQRLHLLPARSRVTRRCGATTGGYARESETTWLRRFVREGGGICPDCLFALGQEGQCRVFGNLLVRKVS